jgi:hypothetical protein
MPRLARTASIRAGPARANKQQSSPKLTYPKKGRRQIYRAKNRRSPDRFKTGRAGS